MDKQQFKDISTMYCYPQEDFTDSETSEKDLSELHRTDILWYNQYMYQIDHELLCSSMVNVAQEGHHSTATRLPPSHTIGDWCV